MAESTSGINQITTPDGDLFHCHKGYTRCGWEKCVGTNH